MVYSGGGKGLSDVRKRSRFKRNRKRGLKGSIQLIDPYELDGARTGKLTAINSGRNRSGTDTRSEIEHLRWEKKTIQRASRIVDYRVTYSDRGRQFRVRTGLIAASATGDPETASIT